MKRQEYKIFREHHHGTSMKKLRTAFAGLPVGSGLFSSVGSGVDLVIGAGVCDSDDVPKTNNDSGCGVGGRVGSSVIGAGVVLGESVGAWVIPSEFTMHSLSWRCQNLQ